MIIRKGEKERAGATTGGRLARRSRLHRGFPLAILLCAVFLLGVVVQREGLLTRMREGVGLDDERVADLRAWLRDPFRTQQALLHGLELPTIQIDMKFLDVQTIEAKRAEALREGLLFASNDDFVPAKIRFADESVRVKMRLKGDLLDHFDGDKWSYRVHVKGDDQLFGMRRFSIQHPKTRNYLYEWGWLGNLRREDILAPRYHIVDVVFNGTAKGIYALEEHFSKELLESQRRREGVIITFDEGPFWRRRAALGTNPPPNDLVNLGEGGYRDALIDSRRSARVAGDPVLATEFDTAVGLLRSFQEAKRNPSEIFDVALLGRFLAVVELWAASHAIVNNNIHFYYNPITARLEPIGFDGDPQAATDAGLHALVLDWTREALRDPELARVYVEELRRVSRPTYLDELREALGEELAEMELALFQEFPRAEWGRVWRNLEIRQEQIRRALSVDSIDLVLAFAQHRAAGGTPGDSSHVEVEVRNISTLPVEVLGFRRGDAFVDAAAIWNEAEGGLSGGETEASVVLSARTRTDSGPVRYSVFRVPADLGRPPQRGDPPAPMAIVTRMLGSATKRETTVRPYAPLLSTGPIPQPPTIAQALAAHPFLSIGDAEDNMSVRPGTWDVKGDLVLPRDVGLKIGPGTTLRFGRDAILLSHGALTFLGSEASPVVLEPRGDSWAGVVVLEAPGPSTWEHVVVKNTHGIERAGWILTGGITFYASPIQLRRTRILGSEAEDGINVVRTSFEFRDCELRGFASDAFDADYTTGLIEDCGFYDVRGDAIDTSGSEVRMRSVVLRDVGDKGISVGEASRVDAQDVALFRIGIGVASKDSSYARLQRFVIEQAEHAGLAAYVKKKEFGPARITADDVEIRLTPRRTLAQTASRIELNGTLIEGTELDAQHLYEAGILGTDRDDL